MHCELTQACQKLSIAGTHQHNAIAITVHNADVPSNAAIKSRSSDFRAAWYDAIAVGLEAETNMGWVERTYRVPVGQ